jgi:hypothetical protein
MPPSNDDKYDPKLFCCGGCGWAVGEVYRERRITQLRVYRNSREFVSKMGVLDVDVLNFILFAKSFVMVKVHDGVVICEHCGASNTWYANQYAIAEMLQRRRNLPKEVVET